MQILVIDDTLAFVEAMTYQFRKLGVCVVAASNATVGLTQARMERPRLVLANAGLLGTAKSADAVARIRREFDCPVVLRGDIHCANFAALCDHLRADDIVDPHAAVPNVMKTLRRVLWRCAAIRVETPPTLAVGDIDIDPDRFEVRVLGRRVQVSVTEMDIIYCLGLSAGHFVSRETLSHCIWSSDPSPSVMKLINAHMRDLRLKIEPDRGEPQYLVTKRTVGYMLRAQPESPNTAARMDWPDVRHSLAAIAG